MTTSYSSTSFGGRDVPSPCIGVCTLDPLTKQCLGCRRTAAEITAWGGMTAAARRTLLEELHQRAAAAGVPDRRRVTRRRAAREAVPPRTTPRSDD